MVFGEALAAGAAGAHSLFSYNRQNFFFDRKQRQENEYKILEWRGAQANLWRDDIRDIIGLTEKKMDNYLIVATLTCGMCLGLFTEGRLEPGTPPWLLHFYMLTLGAAFLYLLMAVWLAMHASVVASCSSVRLLTQFQRLPVPTWQQLEDMRTYAMEYEGLEPNAMLRVPFTGKRQWREKEAPDKGATPDPWKMEDLGVDRDLYELQEKPAVMRRHVALARRAARQYQCFDAFARVAMSFGINQLVNAIAYYSMGYVAVQDGAPWPAATVVAIMVAISMTVVQLDFSLTRRELRLFQALTIGGPASASCATCAWVLWGPKAEGFVMVMLPLAYASHGLWLFFGLVACGLQAQPNGVVLPAKFRAVLYLDVFGWMSSKPTGAALGGAEARSEAQVTAKGGDRSAMYTALTQQSSPERRRDDAEALRRDLEIWESRKVQCTLSEADRQRVKRLASRAHEALDRERSEAGEVCRKRTRSSFASVKSLVQSIPEGEEMQERRPKVQLRGYTDLGFEIPYLYDPETGETTVAYGQDGADSQGGLPRTLSMFEAGVDRYCSDGNDADSTDSMPVIQGSAVSVSCGPMLSAGLSTKAMPEPVVDAFNVIADTPRQHQPPREGGDPTALPAAFSNKSRHGSANPAGEVHDPPSHAFHPESYGAAQAARIEEEDADVDKEDIVTGHDKIDPGRLPAKVFRYATLMLVSFWAVGLALPFGVFRDFMTRPLMSNILVEEMGRDGRKEKEESFKAAIGTRPDGLPELIPDYSSLRDLPSLLEPELVSVDWPTHAGFVPRGLSCDPSGTRLVVADDLGVYVGHLTETVRGLPVLSEPRRGLAEAAAERGASQVAREMSVRSAQQAQKETFVRFERVPPCTALEGQALKDIAVVCSSPEAQSCRVVVLHKRGRRLAECRMYPDPEAPAGEGDDDLSAAAGEPTQTWTISTDWLHGDGHRKGEHVDSMAVNSDCHSQGAASGTFRPNLVGCVVVGTTKGRIVQLRGTLAHDQKLVPERAMEQRARSVGPGSLHVFPNGYVVALRGATGTVQAFDSKLGTSVGEWILPKDIQWICLCGGGDSLLILGISNRTRVNLYRFPVPERLKEGSHGASSALAASRDRNWHLRGLTDQRLLDM